MPKDTLLVCLSDMQTGSNNALFLDRFWQGKNGMNHTPTSKQAAIRAHFDRFTDYVAKARKNKRVILVNVGDATEGVHHNNIDVCTRDLDDQADIHIEIMNGFMKKIGWQRGDKLFYVLGTECHTGDKENEIGKELGAQQADDGMYAFNHLELEINGRSSWFVHHGKTRGDGANEGNSFRNWMRDIYYDCGKVSMRPPDLVFSGHTHTPTYNVYVVSHGESFFMMHGIICPSWQMKTRFAYKVAPVNRNEIGGVAVEINAYGEIKMPVIMKMATESIVKVRA